jgi:hypothetical protein
MCVLEGLFLASSLISYFPKLPRQVIMSFQQHFQASQPGMLCRTELNIWLALTYIFHSLKQIPVEFHH